MPLTNRCNSALAMACCKPGTMKPDRPPTSHPGRHHEQPGQLLSSRIYTSASSSLEYLHGDHLGSMSLSTNYNGSGVSAQEFDPWGNVISGNVSVTSRNFTGQHLDGTGLLFYNARYYDPNLGRFLSADTIVPGTDPLTVWPSDSTATPMWGKGGKANGPNNPQELNRYSYVNNNPVRYTDPTGHWFESAIDLAFIGYDIYDIHQNGLNLTNGLALLADVVSLVLPIVAGGGVAVRTIAHADEVIDAVKSSDDGDLLYRSMKASDDGQPATGASARTLGARPKDDIPLDAQDTVKPETGGVSVSPDSPMNLPPHRRPPDVGGSGKDPVWCIRVCDLGPNLNYRADPKNPTGHGFIEPTYPMSFNAYQNALANTRDRWRRVR
jgi:RHS repeat-associated protein